MLYQIIGVRHDLPIKEYLIDISKYFITSLIMFAGVMLIKYINVNSIIKIGLQVLTGCLIYGLLNIKYIKRIIKSK